MLRVGELDELFDAVSTLASGIEVTGDRLAIISNGGGLGVLATDRLVAEGGRLASLSPATIARLDEAVPPTWSRAIVGIVDDALFGPVVLFGHGGTAVEVLADKALALPPFDLRLARDMMTRTRVFSLLKGYRAKLPADLDAIAVTLLKTAQIAIDIAEVAELDINPLLAGPDGVIALDARIRVARPGRLGTERLAIRPYPKQLEKGLRLSDGTEVLLRPIRPEDASALERTIERTSAEDLRLRFFAPLRRLSPKLEVRLTQIDYDREMAFVAVVEGELLGVVRISADPDNIEAEFAVLVRSDMKGHGLGWALMQEIIAYARGRGTRWIAGKILRENTTMLRMCDELGFVRTAAVEDPSVFEVRLQLSTGA